jgi:AraC family transcriptional regulator
MEPKIIEKDGIILVGMDFCGNPYKEAGGWSHQNEIGRLWQRYSNYMDKHKEKVKNKVSDAGYEVWIDDIEKLDEKEKYIFVGEEISKVEDVPLGLVVKMLPTCTYAVFTLKGKDITSNWGKMIYEEWLPKSGFAAAYDFLIEYYDPARFKGMDNEESELDVYLPIKKHL